MNECHSPKHLWQSPEYRRFYSIEYDGTWVRIAIMGPDKQVVVQTIDSFECEAMAHALMEGAKLIRQRIKEDSEEMAAFSQEQGLY